MSLFDTGHGHVFCIGETDVPLSKVRIQLYHGRVASVRITPHYYFAKSLIDGHTSGEEDYRAYLISQFPKLSANALTEKVSQFRRLAESLSSDNAHFVVLGRVTKDHVLILDGFHRLALYEAAGLATIRVRLTA